MQANALSSIQSAPLAGSIRRFGKDGVLYEVLSMVDDRVARIRVLETGEETTYPIADILRVPRFRKEALGLPSELKIVDADGSPSERSWPEGEWQNCRE